MLRGILVLVLLSGVAGSAAACPGLHNKDKALFFSARQLATPQVAAVRAGGTVMLGHCATLPGAGNIPFDPSVSIHYTAGRGARDLEFRTEGGCDTVLLLRSPTGRWFFDDDNGQGRNARIRLAGPAEGRYEIWVGSQEGTACAARLALQAFRAASRPNTVARR